MLVDVGSKPRCAGVSSALRFCVIESSMLLRDMRRKSVVQPAGALVSGLGGECQEAKGESADLAMPFG